MKNVNAIVMNYDEFEEIVAKITDGNAGIGFDSGEWFYVTSDAYDPKENINKDLSKYLGVTVTDVRIDTSASYDDVIIICE